jgi:nucleoside-triphosphatase THEP1
VTHSAIKGLVHKRFPNCTEVEVVTAGPGEVEVTVKPRWLEPKVVLMLTGSDMVPLGVVFSPGSPMTNFNLKLGLTLVAGGVGTGKTSTLLCIAEELQQEGVDLAFFTAEGIEPIYKHFKPTFEVRTIEDRETLEAAVNQASQGQAVLVDQVGMLVEKMVDDTSIGGMTRERVNFLANLHRRAEERKVYLIVSLQTRRPMGKGKPQEVVLPNGLRRFPVLECHS